MNYYRRINGEREEISYEKALEILLGTFRDNDMTRDMLTLPNRIQCRFSVVEVMDGDLVAAPNLYNLLPMDTEYDDDGMHI